jgi:hypothetical protein
VNHSDPRWKDFREAFEVIKLYKPHPQTVDFFGIQGPTLALFGRFGKLCCFTIPVDQ